MSNKEIPSIHQQYTTIQILFITHHGTERHRKKTQTLKQLHNSLSTSDDRKGRIYRLGVHYSKIIKLFFHICKRKVKSKM